MKIKKIVTKIATFLLFISIISLAMARNINSVVIAKDFSTLSNLSTYELTEKRSEFSKYYVNNDGTISVDTYSAPIHYKDSNGYWADIDNSLKNSVNPFTVINSNSLLNVSLTKNTNIGQLASIAVDDYKLSWKIKNLNESKGKVTNNITSSRIGQSTISSKMAYNNIFKNTDLQYTLTSYALIEELIFSQNPTYDKVIYDVQVEKLKARIENKQVIFYDENNIEKEIFKFSVPFLIDSADNPNISMNVGVELKETKTGYQVIHYLDTEWLSSDNIVYPVTLDPVVTSYQHYSNISDTYTNSSSPNSNYSNDAYLQIGKRNGNNYVYIKINSFPSIASNAEIIDAKLQYYLNKGSSSWGKIEMRALNNSWTSASLTWNNQTNLVSNSSFHSSNITPSYTNGYYKYNVNITEWFKNYHDGIIQNNGFLLRYQDSNYNDCNWIYSSDNLSISSSYLPAITINYKIDNYDYSDFNWHYPLPQNYTTYNRGWSSTHHALDIAVPIGQPLYAVSDGVVSSVLQVGWYSIGNAVAIKTNDIDPVTGHNLVASYGHMNSILVTNGQIVQRGDIIGYSGNTGDSTGPHLHFEVQRNGQNWATHNASDIGNTVNPLLFWP